MIIDRQKKVRHDGKTEIAVSGLLRRKERNKLRGNETRIKREKERGGGGKKGAAKRFFSRNADSSRVEKRPQTRARCSSADWRSTLLRSIRYRFANLKTFLSAKISEGIDGSWRKPRDDDNVTRKEARKAVSLWGEDGIRYSVLTVLFCRWKKRFEVQLRNCGVTESRKMAFRFDSTLLEKVDPPRMLYG